MLSLYAGCARVCVLVYAWGYICVGQRSLGVLWYCFKVIIFWRQGLSLNLGLADYHLRWWPTNPYDHHAVPRSPWGCRIIHGHCCFFYICIGALKSGSHALEAFSPVFRKAVGVEGVSEEEARGLRAHSALAVEQVQFPALKWNLTTVWNFRSGDLTTSFVCHRHQSCTYIFAYT